MTLHDLAPHVGITCLIIQTIIAVFYFFKHRRLRKTLSEYRAERGVKIAESASLRAQNARLIQTVARLRGDIRDAEKMCVDFKLEEER